MDRPAHNLKKNSKKSDFFPNEFDFSPYKILVNKMSCKIAETIKNHKIAVTFMGILGAFILALFPLPLQVTDKDKEYAVSHALAALISDNRVLSSKGYCRLYDSSFVKNNGRLFFTNELGIADEVFVMHGLKPVPQDRKLDVDAGDVVVSFSYLDSEGH